MSDDRIRAAELADEIEALLRDDRVIELSVSCRASAKEAADEA